MAPYGAVQRHSTLVTYEHEKVDEENKEDDEKEKVRPPSFKQPSQKKTKKRSSQQEEKGFIHKPPGRKPNILYVY